MPAVAGPLHSPPSSGSDRPLEQMVIRARRGVKGERGERVAST